jgi:hypothetical protein
MPKYIVTITVANYVAQSKADAENHFLRLLGHANYNVTAASAHEELSFRQTAQAAEAVPPGGNPTIEDLKK